MGAPVDGPQEFEFDFDDYDECEAFVMLALRQFRAGLRLGKASRAVKPRYEERDAEVERLRKEQRSWKEIHRRIKANPKWSLGQNGEPVTKEALREAYSRRKGMR